LLACYNIALSERPNQDAGASRLDRSSRCRLNERALHLFEGETLFAKIARALCHASCLPRKELFEAWEVAKRTRRRFQGGHVVELCAGHGLVAQMMLLLDPSLSHAICLDRRRPKSAAIVEEVLAERWPRLRDRVRYEEASLSEAKPSSPEAIVVAVHACGTLSDGVLDHAVASRSRLALLPCCHSHNHCDTGGFEAWIDGSIAIDMMRAQRLRANGFEVWARLIPVDITPMNRLLLARPLAAG
jgi:Methyltransferase domain